MPSIRVQTDDIILWIDSIDDNIAEYKRNASDIVALIEAFPYWTGSDKETYSANASKAAEAYSKIADELTAVNDAMRICMKKYETCFDTIKKAANTI